MEGINPQIIPSNTNSWSWEAPRAFDTRRRECLWQLVKKKMKGACIAPNKTGASTGSPCALNP